MSREHTILTIDEGDDFCEELFLLLSESGFNVRSAPDTSRARALLGERDFDLVILGAPGYFTDETMSRAAAAVEQLGIADLATPPLVVLTYEPSFAWDVRTLPGVTAISLHNFEINRFLEAIQRAIGNV